MLQQLDTGPHVAAQVEYAVRAGPLLTGGCCKKTAEDVVSDLTWKVEEAETGSGYKVFVHDSY